MAIAAWAIPSCKEDTKGKYLLESPGTVAVLDDRYVVFAWSDQGVHFLSSSYDRVVLLPPYSNLRAQVMERGNPPRYVTSGVTVEYSIAGNSFSYGKGSYGQFWDNSLALFGVSLAPNTGLNFVDPGVHNGLSGQMLLKGLRFQADGIPATPILDDGTTSYYQTAEIVVRDASGAAIARTQATLPVSDEVNCARCHGADPFADMLAKHDAKHGTTLAGQIPVLCARCHASPAANGTTARLGGVTFLSEAMHRSHAPRGAACYNCHPGATTRFNRSIGHTAPTENCSSLLCHGTMDSVASTITLNSRVPWLNEPRCVSCHGFYPEMDTGSVLYREANAHNGTECLACHGSPHAMVPADREIDNRQAIQLQGKAESISSCGTCHKKSKGQSPLAKFFHEHGGVSPKTETSCQVCHTGFRDDDFNRWPHAFQWRER